MIEHHDLAYVDPDGVYQAGAPTSDTYGVSDPSTGGRTKCTPASPCTGRSETDAQGRLVLYTDGGYVTQC